MQSGGSCAGIHALEPGGELGGPLAAVGVRSAADPHEDERVPTVDPRRAQVGELRFWGLSVEETAAALQVSPDTVMRD